MDDGPIRCILLFAICLSGCVICSASETAFAAVSRARMMNRADKGDKSAAKVVAVLDDFDFVLSANLILNDICSAGCGTTAALVSISLGGGALTETIVVAVSTIVLFFFGEMMPKSVARDCPEAISSVFAGFMLFLVRVLHPIVSAFTKLSRFIMSKIPGGDDDGVTYTENELDDIIDTVTEDESEPPERGRLIRSAYGFSDFEIGAVTTPWEATQTLDVRADFASVTATADATLHSRFPVTDGGIPVGILYLRGYLKRSIECGNKAVAGDVMTKPFYISEDTPADDAIEKMSRAKATLAIVTGEGGKIVGIITVEDILEVLVGDMDEEIMGAGGAAV
ncbi:MAG: CNNM domain-containing protein [Firmicutes bacterium]|nr:CNNM domain-containing protein [Bacillota bacterium]